MWFTSSNVVCGTPKLLQSRESRLIELGFLQLNNEGEDVVGYMGWRRRRVCLVNHFSWHDDGYLVEIGNKLKAGGLRKDGCKVEESEST